ncbi:MAG: polysaccharide export protein [Hyphomonadaceae bacterium]|nr:polysaccharide export protein [Hyphomonadaceae bacterium]
MSVLKRALGALALLLSLAGCFGGPPAAPAPAPGAEAEVLRDYHLGPADRLRINVFNEPTVSGEFVVSPTGSIAYPLIGEFPAEGKTLTEFTTTLSTALQRYIRQPSISVEVMNYRPYYILGEVRAPREYPYTSGLTIFNAVAIAGGFTERADSRRVFIKRKDEDSEREYRLTSETLVQPGDTVRIAERRF